MSSWESTLCGLLPGWCLFTRPRCVLLNGHTWCQPLGGVKALPPTLCL